jgi:peptidoglycan/xylan/chitin deacetylase (PgdA/CDA1 family)
MTVPETLHRIPRHPYRWLPVALASQALVAALWWHWGWRIGLPALLASHAALLLPVFLPRAWLYAPVLSRLPGTAPQVWLTIDDGPSDDTAPLLEVLDCYQAKATFFLVGTRAAARPATSVRRRPVPSARPPPPLRRPARAATPAAESR